MKSIEIEKQRETKLKAARLETGFYNIIGGQRAVAASQLSVINPATEEELATVPNIAAIAFDDAVAAARKAFDSWHAIPLERRKEAVARVLTEIDAHADELSTLLTAEQGRPLSQAQWEINLLTKHYGPAVVQMDIPESEQHVENIGQVFKRYTPIGVVGAIIPWNLPVLLSFAKTLAALIAGNTVVLKPSPFAPLTVLRIADYIRELLPAGVLNTVTGDDDLGPGMTSHPLIGRKSPLWCLTKCSD
jgi:acyl-CoA reductase-like NAD-dependent aldehyde dehydrogenase